MPRAVLLAASLVVASTFVGLVGGAPRAGPTTLGYSSYFGGSGYDEGQAIAIGPDGGVYLAGTTTSPDVPGGGSARADGDVFVTRLAADGKTILWTQVVGSSGYDAPTDIKVSTDGSVYVTGWTTGADWPVVGVAAYGRSFGGVQDAFLLRLSSSGSVVFSEYFGGRDADTADALDLDAQGRAVIGGSTWSCDFPTYDRAYRSAPAGCVDMESDAFVARFWPDGALNRVSLFGGDEADWLVSLAVSQSTGSITFAGATVGELPVSASAADRTMDGGSEAFVAKLDGSLESLHWATYLGGSGSEWANALVRDQEGNSYVVGTTYSGDFPATSGRAQSSFASPTGCQDGPATFDGPCSDGFVAKVSYDGVRIAWSTYVGGAGSEGLTSVVLDKDGNVWATGTTDSGASFTGGPSGDRGISDAFLVSLDRNATAFRSMTLLGGDGWDEAFDLAHRSGAVWATGFTESTDFPVTSDANDRALTGTRDAFLVRVGQASGGGTFAASFQPKGNEWWIETKVTGAERVVAVDVSLDGGAWKPLNLQWWGNWAKSYHAPEGTVVQLRATSASGATALSSCYRWVSATVVACDGSGGDDAFRATFTNPKGNEWWLQIHVDATRALAGVDASINGGAWRPLDLKSWGDWAKSYHAPAGSDVVFRARAVDGSVVESATYEWPPT